MCLRFNTSCIYIFIITFSFVKAIHITLPPIQHSQVEQFLERAGQKMGDMYSEFDKNIEQKGARQIKGSPAYYMASFYPMKPSAYNMTQTSLVIEEATRYMADAYTLSKEQITFALSEMDISYTTMGQKCPMTADPPCKPRKYRSISGYCNNVQNPHWGNAYTQYARLLPPAYEDGVSMPRGEALNGQKILPSARKVSINAHTDEDVQHDYLAALAVIWGQFVAHDIAHTPLASGRNGAPLKCCGVNFSEFHPECYPIKMPETSDRSPARHRERCQEFVRSGSAVRTGCSLGPREQLNQVTAFLDGSTIYGSSSQETEQLREFQGGKLKSQDIHGDLLMPGDEKMDCRNNATDFRCFMSGDIRANENIGLAALHTLWLREHNRIATELGVINRHWNDETIFQETRRLVIAEIQHITYNEFLPTILSQIIIDKYDLKLEKTGHFTDYNINSNPSTINSVAHAALWFTATLMPDILVIPGVDRDEDTMRLSDTFYSVSELYENDGYDRVLVGLLQSSSQKDDSTITDVMMNDLFKDEDYKGSGLDLAAQIIQRGRDHGLPSYIQFRNFCGLKKVESFEDLDGITTPKMKNSLKKIYKNVSDIDLFSGALSELSMLGSVIGPTFSCLLGHQFKATREGDRHWFENNFPPSSFNLKQLDEIRKVSLARLICDNSKIQNIQPKAFLKSDEYLNTKMPCSSSLLPHLEFLHWNQVASVIILNSETLKTAMSQAEDDMKEILDLENAQFTYTDPGSPITTAFKFNRPKRDATMIANTSLLLQLTSVRLMNKYIDSFQDQESKIKNLKSEKFERLMTSLPEIDLYNIINIPDTLDCDEPSLPCDHTTPYRSVTGRCNNLNNPHFGKSMRPFNRLLTPIYDDGIGSPRQTSISGQPLPSARLVSFSLHKDISAPHRRYSLMLMQLAQIVDHDLTHTPVNVKHLGTGVLDCSPCSNTITGCIPIPIPPNDPFYPNIDPITNQAKCIPVTRSLPSRLTLGRREQMNQVTAYLDGSFIYGSDTCEVKQLRSFHGGKLNVTEQKDSKPLLPETDSNPECRADTNICFRAGDLRASEQPGLASLHTMFLREHNRIANDLSRLNQHWIDEEIYQESRKIVIAMLQHIVFSEFLPRIFGWEHLEKYGLDLERNGYFKGYNPNCDATLVNEFSAAAYRFGHTLLRPVFRRMNNKNVLEPGIRLRDHFFNPALLYNKNMVDELLTGLASTPMETFDRFVTNEVSNHLFEDKNIPFSGMDLPAINVQRGRDHGIRGYNEYREICNLTKAATFEELGDLIPLQTIIDLKNIYSDIDDIDLFPGGLVEESLKGGIIGPTFACIVGNQFRKLRECDRFWYENDNVFTRFTSDQLNEIRKSKLSRIICDNSDITILQRETLELPDPFLNPRVSCHGLKPLNLKHWKEQKRCIVKGTIIEMGTYEKISPCVACICTKEGVICESMKIDSCFSLAKSHSWDSILKDSVCKVQCAYAFSFMSTEIKNTTLLGLT